VTRFGEFSPIGRLFTLDSLLKIAEVSLIFGLLFSVYKVIVLILTNMDILGEVVLTISGHTAPRRLELSNPARVNVVW
jgi:hypothetical protein